MLTIVLSCPPSSFQLDGEHSSIKAFQGPNIEKKLHFYEIQTGWHRRCWACQVPASGSNRPTPSRSSRTRTGSFPGEGWSGSSRPEIWIPNLATVARPCRRWRPATGRTGRRGSRGSGRPPRWRSWSRCEGFESWPRYEPWPRRRSTPFRAEIKEAFLILARQWLKQLWKAFQIQVFLWIHWDREFLVKKRIGSPGNRNPNFPVMVSVIQNHGLANI